MWRGPSIWDELRRMQEEMDSLFNSFIGSRSSFGLLPGSSMSEEKSVITPNYRQPLADVFETDKELIMNIELPGVDKKDIEVELKGNNLEVKVERKEEHKTEDKKKGFYRLERSYAGFYRQFPLPENVNKDKIDASYKNGVLEIRIPKKSAKSSKGSKINIK